MNPHAFASALCPAAISLRIPQAMVNHNNHRGLSRCWLAHCIYGWRAILGAFHLIAIGATPRPLVRRLAIILRPIGLAAGWEAAARESQGWGRPISRKKGWRDMAGREQQGAQRAVATAVHEMISGVRQGEPVRVGALTLIPLLPTAERKATPTGYLPLHTALEQQVVTISEQARESVPELLAVSVSDAPVVLVGGEQVIGGLQNRVLNTTILLAPHVSLNIPVTCVEAGRWHDARAISDEQPADSAPQLDAEARYAQGRRFSSDEAAYASLRKKHYAAVSGSLATGGGHTSDQGAVWGEVASRMRTTGSFSPSGAMDALFKSPERARKLRETVAELKRPEGALGFVAMLGGRPLGAELFADEALAGEYWEKLARSYAVEALDASDGAAEAETDSAPESQLLADALAARIEVHASPGLGEDARLAGDRVSGGGLVYNGVAVHLSLFPEDEDGAAASPTRAQPIWRHAGQTH